MTSCFIVNLSLPELEGVYCERVIKTYSMVNMYTDHTGFYRVQVLCCTQLCVLYLSADGLLEVCSHHHHDKLVSNSLQSSSEAMVAMTSLGNKSLSYLLHPPRTSSIAHAVPLIVD